MVVSCPFQSVFCGKNHICLLLKHSFTVGVDTSAATPSKDSFTRHICRRVLQFIMLVQGTITEGKGSVQLTSLNYLV